MRTNTRRRLLLLLHLLFFFFFFSSSPFFFFFFFLSLGRENRIDSKTTKARLNKKKKFAEECLLFGGRVHNGFSSIFLCLYFHSKCPPNNRENVVHGRRQIAEVKVKVILFPFRVDDVSVSVISTGAQPRNVGDASVRRVVELSGTGYPFIIDSNASLR